MTENDEVSIITHLLELEKASSRLIDDAAKEAQNRTALARSELNSTFKKEYEKVVQDFDIDFQKESKELITAHENAVENYKKEITEIPKNKEAFNTLLGELLNK